MYNLEFCDLIFDQNTLRDISVWAQASWTQRLFGKLNPKQIQTFIKAV
jgi:hypothetical protein